jgi:hypothetical protein
MGNKVNTTQGEEQEASTGFNPNATQIAAYKKKHGEIHMITVVDDRTDEKKEYKCIVKRPDRKTLSVAMQFGSNNIMKFNETIFVNCWVDGDQEIRNDEYLQLSAESQCGTTVKVAESAIVKL